MRELCGGSARIVEHEDPTATLEKKRLRNGTLEYQTRRLRNVERSSCCNARVDWTSYSTDYEKFPKNRGLEDHFVCAKCDKPCKVVDEDGQVIWEEALWSESLTDSE